MTGLEPFSALGMANIENSGPFYLNDASIIFPVGNQIVQQSLDTGERTFLLSSRLTEGSSTCTGLTAFSVSSDGNYIALATTRRNESPLLTVYSSHNCQKIMQLQQENSFEISFVSFHKCLKQGLFLVSDPRLYRLTLFSVQSKCEIASVRFHNKFETAFFHPKDDSLVILYSPKSLAYYRTSDEYITIINVPNYSLFSGFVFSFTEENTSVATSKRDILFFNDMQLKDSITITEDSSINLICPYHHGFICATDDYKFVVIQHAPGRRDMIKTYQQGTILPFRINHPAKWISFSPNGHQMVCNVDHRQAIIINTSELESNSENCIVDINIYSHKGPVASISSCAYKPMLVSCGSEDKTVIVWDYSKQISVLHSEFEENLADVSFHPSGDLIAVASTDKLYLLAATVDSLIMRAQWPLFNCLSIEFSNGGHFLVAASHIITFINPYTQDIIATLRGHSGLIHSLSWSPDDKRLVSCGSDGSIVEWDAVTQEQEWTVNIPKSDFESIVITDKGTVIAVAKTEIIHHLFNGRHQTRIAEGSAGFSAVHFPLSSAIILGDLYGTLMVIPFPFVIPPQHQNEFENIPLLEFSESQEASVAISEVPIPFMNGEVWHAHCGKVTSICSSLDSRVLFTSSSDSSIYVFNILNLTQIYAKSSVPILRCDVPRQQFFLVGQTKFDELQQNIEKLKRDIQKQRSKYELDTIAALQNHQDIMDDIANSNEEKKRKLQSQIDSLQKSMDDSTVKAALIYQNMESSHLQEAKALTNLYEQKLSLETSKCDTIEKELEDLKCSYEERIYLLRQQYKSSLQDFSDKVDIEQKQLIQNLENTKDKIDESQREQDKALIELEVEFEKERMAIHLEYHNKIAELNRQLEDIKARQTNVKKEIEHQRTELNALEAELKNAKDKKSDLDKEIKALEHTFECRTSELHDRDETLARQAERLEKLQESNIELEKNKDIMNFRIEEMERELQPSLDEISRLSSELDGNSEEIRTIKRFSKANHRTMRDKAHQIEVLKRKLEQKQAVLAKKRRVIQMFMLDLKEGALKNDVTHKANILKQMHDKYVANHNVEETLKDANETINEQTRQRKHLQESVMLLQRQVHQQQDMSTRHYKTKSSENSVLLSELNRLKKENHMLHQKLENAKTDQEMLESNLKKVRAATQEQMMGKQKRMAKTALQPTRVMGDWVKQKTKTATTSHVSVVDSRGKYLHSGLKT